MPKKEKETKKLDMKEIFDSIDNKTYENMQIRNILDELLEANKDNEALMAYFTLTKKLEENIETIEQSKKDLYEPMLEKNCDYLEGKSVSVSLKKPYIKKEFDKETFIKDYTEETYNKYLKEKEVKGNCTIKQNTSVTLSKVSLQEVLKKEEA